MSLRFGQHATMISSNIRLCEAEVRLHIFCGARGGFAIETLALPRPAQRAPIVNHAPPSTWELLQDLQERLFPKAALPHGGTLVIEALAYPFLGEALSETQWRPHPGWLLVYWHRYLLSTGRVNEGADLLRLPDVCPASRRSTQHWVAFGMGACAGVARTRINSRSPPGTGSGRRLPLWRIAEGNVVSAVRSRAGK